MIVRADSPFLTRQFIKAFVDNCSVVASLPVPCVRYNRIPAGACCPCGAVVAGVVVGLEVVGAFLADEAGLVRSQDLATLALAEVDR